MFLRLAVAAATIVLYSGSPATAQSSATANGSLTIVQPLTITKNADLRFGSILRSTTSDGTVQVDVSGLRSVSGGVESMDAGDTPQAAAFTIAGEGGHAVSVTIPSSFVLSNGSEMLTVATAHNLSGSLSAQTLSGSAGAAGQLDVRVGGSVAVSTATVAGLYSGSFTVSTAYN
ncbi:DUF4402 domain-containing protein [Croceicoccus sp. YJ47]|uniref:DUF4402 domain-containing protein n=1 Tax=Croceicoccus sp. YJ47 TaxID=2798724 RepID=UPI001921638F|nr:DUF4402 domain-containing protein [Croceicoccus sp. YJ47]QQN73724.1 DUF4402 domain-containing protein [Croceicoccus sp. YJ47]